MDGSAAPPAEHALATILQTENRQMGHALAHGRLTPPLVAHHAGQRQFARCSSRAVSRERWALLFEKRALLLTKCVRLVSANSQRVAPLHQRARNRARSVLLRLFAREPRALLLRKHGQRR